MSTDPQPTPEQEAATPTCYRHPQRETYVRCTRCDRYICPDCMRSAAVGHQCVECVTAGNKTIRSPRTVFGGRVSVTPAVTYTLIGLNVLVFFVQNAVNGVENRYGLWPPGVAAGQYERLLTSAFLHYGPLHLLFNMWALYVVGQPLEQWLGRLRFAALYVLSALGGSVLALLFAPLNSNTAGASGAVFGLFAAVFVVSKRLQFDARGIAVLIGVNLLITFTFPNISW
ncbi:MAG: rhomboid family intramembrane serine protease, partial [Actinomadura sp.]